MSALDKLQEKGEYTEIESVIVTYAFHERRARGDDKNPASIKAAAELAALTERVKRLEILEQRVARIAKFRNWLDYEILEIIDAYDALQEAQ